MRLSGATVLLTGATGGVGRALAARLGAAGARLVLTGRRREDLAELAEGLPARIAPADLADLGQVAALAETCGDIDVLVANAALPASGDLREYTPEQIARALTVNLHAPVLLARALAPRMAAAGRGHLVFVGSMSGKAATPESSLYTATKFGLRGFAHSLRQDLAGDRVGVSLVQPGFVGGAGMFADTGAAVPGGQRTVSPDQVADAVVRAVERDRAEINVAPAALRWRCAVAGQFPGWSGRPRRDRTADPAARAVVEAQRRLR